jgi:transcriptional antiterminator RfaH
MPLLELEPFKFPNDLLEAPAEWQQTAARWWVLHTRPRAEKSLARRLLRFNIPFFLPLYKKQWRSRGRVLQSHNPLFPGYLFIHGDELSRGTALKTNLVARSLDVKDQIRLEQDLSRIHHLMATGLPLTPEEQLLPGTLVEITSGPLSGLTGTILRRGKQWKVFVEVQFLQRGVSVEMECWSVRQSG